MYKKGTVIQKKQYWIMIASVVLVSLIFGSSALANKIIVFIIMALLVNPFLAYIVNNWMDDLGLGWLDEIDLKCEIGDYEISVTAYAILTEILLFILF